MRAPGCQSDCLSGSVPRAAHRAVAAAGAVVLAAVLAACAPLSESTDGAVTTSASAGRKAQPVRVQPTPAAEEPSDPHLYELEWPDVDQQGLASWYGPGFHGRKTANGERFNQYELTAAHPTYAFGTQLCVRSKATGNTVVVRVNDRGPFVKNRVIDLSKAAAEELGMLSKGVKAVEIYKLDEGEQECPPALLQAASE